MKDNNNIESAKNAITRFLQVGNAEDEYFLVTFNQNTNLVQRFTSESSIQNEIAFKNPGGAPPCMTRFTWAWIRSERAKREEGPDSDYGRRGQ